MASKKQNVGTEEKAGTAPVVSYKGFNSDWTCRGFRGREFGHNVTAVWAEAV